MSEKQKVTAARADDALEGARNHAAPGPAISMKQQTDRMRDGELWGPHCNACNHDQITPMVRCTQCQSRDIVARQFSPEGKIISYTIQNVAPEIFMNEVPYAFAVIALDDGPKVSGWIGFISRASELPAGQSVQFVSSYKPGMQFEKC